MLAYIVRRLLLIVPTLLGIMVINFVIINMAPGGPIEQLIANLRQGGDQVAERTGSSRGQETGIGRQERQPGEQSRAGRGPRSGAAGEAAQAAQSRQAAPRAFRP